MKRVPFGIFMLAAAFSVSCGLNNGGGSSSLGVGSGFGMKMKMSGRAVNEDSMKAPFKPTPMRVYVGVSGALIELDGTNGTTNTALTDDNGNFQITNLDAGMYYLTISKTNAAHYRYWAKMIISIVSSDVSLGDIYIHRNPIVNGITVNGANYQYGNLTVAAGQYADIAVYAEDPNNLPLQYVFYRFRHCGYDVTVQDWTNTNGMRYTFQDGDAVNGFSIAIGVKNNDSNDYDSAFFGDLQKNLNFTVTNGMHPAQIQSVTVLKTNAVTTNRSFYVGETVTLVVNAIDPLSLPLQYVFHRFRQCGFESTLQTWSNTNVFTYTFVTNDAVNGFGIWVGARNNDGVDYDSTLFGDAQFGVGFNVLSDKLPSQITNVLVKMGGVATNTRNFHVGDTVEIVVLASDPKSLPIQYVFHRFRNCGFESTLQTWTSASNFTYTFVTNDCVSGFGIWAGARNNDGVCADSDLFGDTQFGVGFNVTEF